MDCLGGIKTLPIFVYSDRLSPYFYCLLMAAFSQ